VSNARAEGGFGGEEAEDDAALARKVEEVAGVDEDVVPVEQLQGALVVGEGVVEF
jgi:hypothetical protein